MASISDGKDTSDQDELIKFRLEANVNTYAAFMNETDSTRLDSHDFRYENGSYTYYDTYVGGEQFAGEEAVWKNGKAVYAMNYLGRVLEQTFSGNFTWFQGYEEIYHKEKKFTSAIFMEEFYTDADFALRGVHSKSSGKLAAMVAHAISKKFQL